VGSWTSTLPAAGDWARSLIRGQQDISGTLPRPNARIRSAFGRKIVAGTLGCLPLSLGQRSRGKGLGGKPASSPSRSIGFAGGLNAYRFAAGDPVSYSDTYGLCPYGQELRYTRADYCPLADATERYSGDMVPSPPPFVFEG
jgi:hypothetical protein